jgi:hypothetical protein
MYNFITDYHAKYYAYELTRQFAADGVDRLSQSLFDATVDLNPHQINAALFALHNPFNKGVILADEVGLGKTIEAGLVLCQYWAERKRQLLIICPASLRKQWAQELQDKFNLPSQILDANTWRQLKKQGIPNPLHNNCINILSYHFAVRLEESLLIEPWHLVVMDEAHKLRNAYRTSNKSDDLETDYLEELDNDSVDDTEQAIDKKQLELEILELQNLIEQAEKISDDSKAQALLIALNQGFEQMALMNAPRKAVIFTESKRTQEYLQTYLAANHYSDKLVTFNGTNNSPETTQIYRQWLLENKGSDKITGSPQIDRRTALIEHFQFHAEIMIATEAGAEGVNLQFCSLVINYDLPWNPQRVEQRIGRCHRYGQKFDVVVINFINQSNYADQRVLELLTDKFHLFDGVFGASDDVLGSIESGIDFEKRIQAIYETCRTIEQIETAFTLLQQEMEGDINKQMTETRQQLLDNFDEDIHNLLKLQLDQAEQRLDKISRWFWAVTQHQLKAYARFDDHHHRFNLHDNVTQEVPLGDYQLVARGQSQSTTSVNAYVYRLNHPLGEWVLETAKNKATPTALISFDYAAHGAKISVIESLLGQSGTLKLQRFSIEALERTEDHLMFAAETSDGKLLPAETAQKLMQLPAAHCQLQSVLASSQLEAQLTSSKNDIIKMVNSRNLSFFEEEVNKLDHWADDLKFGLEHGIKDIDQQIKEVRRQAKIAPTLEEKLSWQKNQRDLERARNKQRKELFDRQDEVDERREALIEQLESKLNQKLYAEDLFTIGWSL